MPLRLRESAVFHIVDENDVIAHTMTFSEKAHAITIMRSMEIEAIIKNSYPIEAERKTAASVLVCYWKEISEVMARLPAENPRRKKALPVPGEVVAVEADTYRPQQESSR